MEHLVGFEYPIERLLLGGCLVDIAKLELSILDAYQGQSVRFADSKYTIRGLSLARARKNIRYHVLARLLRFEEAD